MFEPQYRVVNVGFKQLIMCIYSGLDLIVIFFKIFRVSKNDLQSETCYFVADPFLLSLHHKQLSAIYSNCQQGELGTPPLPIVLAELTEYFHLPFCFFFWFRFERFLLRFEMKPFFASPCTKNFVQMLKMLLPNDSEFILEYWQAFAFRCCVLCAP